MENIHVIIAHYNENLSWTNNLTYPFSIISRKNIPRETPPNKGHEASSYLEYIIYNYANLPDVCIFVHGHRNDWHHKQNMDDKIYKLQFNHSYYNINDLNVDSLKNQENALNMLQKYIHVFNEILNQNIVTEKIKYKPCAQFYVKKQNILRNSKDKYIKLYDFLMKTNVQSYWSGRFFEYLWHFIFTGNYEDIN